MLVSAVGAPFPTVCMQCSACALGCSCLMKMSVFFVSLCFAFFESNTLALPVDHMLCLCVRNVIRRCEHLAPHFVFLHVEFLAPTSFFLGFSKRSMCPECVPCVQLVYCQTCPSSTLLCVTSLCLRNVIRRCGLPTSFSPVEFLVPTSFFFCFSKRFFCHVLVCF